MAFTQAQVDALKTALAAGVRTVAYSDRTITYQSIAEMLQLLAAMESEVAGSGESAGRSTFAAPRRD